MGNGFWMYLPYDSQERWFIDYRELNEGKVLMGNNDSCKVVGVGQ